MNGIIHRTQRTADVGSTRRNRQIAYLAGAFLSFQPFHTRHISVERHTFSFNLDSRDHIERSSHVMMHRFKSERTKGEKAMHEERHEPRPRLKREVRYEPRQEPKEKLMQEPKQESKGDARFEPRRILKSKARHGVNHGASYGVSRRAMDKVFGETIDKLPKGGNR